MTYFHELWDPPLSQDALPQGRTEIQRAQQIGGGSDRERRFIRALALFYDQEPGAIPFRARVSKYESAMGEVAAAYPADVVTALREKARVEATNRFREDAPAKLRNNAARENASARVAPRLARNSN